MNHNEAVKYVNEQNGKCWGGYSSMTSIHKVLPEWQQAWCRIYDENELRILRFAAVVEGGWNRWAICDLRLRDQIPDDLKERAYAHGLGDSEGDMAVADYIRARMLP